MRSTRKQTSLTDSSRLLELKRQRKLNRVKSLKVKPNKQQSTRNRRMRLKSLTKLNQRAKWLSSRFFLSMRGRAEVYDSPLFLAVY